MIHFIYIVILTHTTEIDKSHTVKEFEIYPQFSVYMLSKMSFMTLNVLQLFWVHSLKVVLSLSVLHTHTEQPYQCANGSMCLPGISSVYSDEGIKDKGWISHYHSQEINHTSGIHRNTQTHTVCVFYDLMCWLSVLNEPCTSLNGINPFFVCLSILLFICACSVCIQPCTHITVCLHYQHYCFCLGHRTFDQFSILPKVFQGFVCFMEKALDCVLQGIQQGVLSAGIWPLVRAIQPQLPFFTNVSHNFYGYNFQEQPSSRWFPLVLVSAFCRCGSDFSSGGCLQLALEKWFGVKCQVVGIKTSTSKYEPIVLSYVSCQGLAATPSGGI